MVMRSIFSALSPGQLEFLFRTMAVFVGSFFSPVWRIFREAVEPWIDVRALAHSDRPILEIIDFYHRMQMNRELLTTTLLPKLFLCLVLSLAFLFICNKLGQLAARYVVRTYTLSFR